MTCPLHTHLVESEPIIPVPDPEQHDDDDGTGDDDTRGYDDSSEDTRLDVSTLMPFSLSTCLAAASTQEVLLMSWR